MINIIIQRSNRKNKKYVAKIYDKMDKPKKIHFGDNRYQDYTMHKNEARKESYLKRHKNEDWYNIYTPGFWATNLLWNKPTIKESIKDIKQRFNINSLIYK